MNRIRNAVLGGLLPALVTGLIGGTGLTAVYAGLAFWRGATLDIFGAKIEPAQPTSQFLVGPSLINMLLAVFVVGWLAWAYTRWNDADGPSDPAHQASNAANPN